MRRRSDGGGDGGGGGGGGGGRGGGGAGSQRAKTKTPHKDVGKNYMIKEERAALLVCRAVWVGTCQF